MFSKFILAAYKDNVSQLVIQGSKQFPWQEKAFKDFKRLMPSVQMEWL